MSGARWTAGLAVSALIHAAGFGGLLLAVRPDEVEDQPVPPSELDVQAYQLDRTSAREAEPEAEAASESDAQGAPVDAGAIPQSRARLATAQAESMSAKRPTANRVAATRDQAAQIPAAPPPAAQLAPAPMAGSPLAPAPSVSSELSPAETAPARLTQAEALAQPVQQQVALARPVEAASAEPAVLRAGATQAAAITAVAAPASALRPATSAAVALPTATPPPLAVPAVAPPPSALPEAAVVPAALSEAVPSGQNLPANAPEAPSVAPSVPDAAALPDRPANPQPLQQAVADAAPAPPAIPQAQSVKATLAFPGGDGDVDPASLAAFQSFMRPGDVTAEGDPLRDGVSALLAQVPCSRLQVAFDPDTATLRINGHIPENDLRAPVLAALQAQMGEDILVSDNILILPRPQCGSLAGIGDVGLPQSNDQSTNPLLIGADTHARVLDFVKDDRLWFEITAPDYDAYVYVDFFDAGGNVLHLAPNDQVPLALATRDSALRVGTQTDADTGLKILIGPPYGQEIAVAFAASEPLYDGLRPLIEPAAPYLEFLKSRVAARRAEHPDFKGEWVYFFVTTAER